MRLEVPTGGTGSVPNLPLNRSCRAVLGGATNQVLNGSNLQLPGGIQHSEWAALQLTAGDP